MHFLLFVSSPKPAIDSSLRAFFFRVAIKLNPFPSDQTVDANPRGITALPDTSLLLKRNVFEQRCQITIKIDAFQPKLILVGSINELPFSLPLASAQFDLAAIGVNQYILAQLRDAPVGIEFATPVIVFRCRLQNLGNENGR